MENIECLHLFQKIQVHLHSVAMLSHIVVRQYLRKVNQTSPPIGYLCTAEYR